MAANKKLLILPGDGIGPEVMREVRRVSRQGPLTVTDQTLALRA